MSEPAESVPEKIEARWTATGYDPFTGVRIECTSCEKGICDQGNRNPKFCPNCGAQMENWSNGPDNLMRALDTF